MRMLRTPSSCSESFIHSVNQLSIYGALSNWCVQFGLIADEKGREKILEKVESLNKKN